MRSNQLKIAVLFMTVAALTACNGSTLTDKDNENVIGQNLESVAPLRDSSGAQKEKVVFFDDFIKQIHQFDMNIMAVDRTLGVLNPGSKHYVLHSGNSNYIVDFSEQHISIFDSNSQAQHRPITFAGKPKSAAFRPDLGFLIFYDDLQSVGVIKLSATGQVTDKYVFGPLVAGVNSIVSGDLLDDGRLILALSDNSIALVDLNASLLTAPPKTYVKTVQATTLSRINWIAPVPAVPGRVLIKTSDKVVLYDYGSASIIQEIALGSNEVIKLSKSYDPHVVIRTSSTSMRLIFTNGASLQTRDFDLANRTEGSTEVSPILNSDLDLAKDAWTYVYLTSYRGFSLYNDVNQKTDRRTLVRVRVSDNLAITSKALKDRAQIKLSSDYFFALSPSPLGLAEKYSVLGSDVSRIERFNLGHF